MPIEYDIKYNDVSGDPVCCNASAVTVTVVQDYIVMHPDATTTSELVERITVYYSPDVGGDPTGQFVLTVVNLANYEMGTMETTPPVIIAGSSGDVATLAGIVKHASNDYTVTFNAPTGDPSTVVFQFGTGAPGTKLKVKIKKQSTAICGD